MLGTSPDPDLNFSCDGPDESSNREWGDYASASPDPAAPTTDSRGRVFLTATYSVDGREDSTLANWLTATQL